MPQFSTDKWFDITREFEKYVQFLITLRHKWKT